MPQVFISYHQLDDAHRVRVRAFADRLRDCGIHVVLDQFYQDRHPEGPPEGWQEWSINQAIVAQRILIIESGLRGTAEVGILRERISDQLKNSDLLRIAYVEPNDINGMPEYFRQVKRFHTEADFDNILKWLGVLIPSRTPFSGWVWTSSLASRAAGKKSVLACVETLIAIAAYWWIAWRFDTHWHLVSSVLIAPLLLLRSPGSITAAVHWFRKYESQSTAKCPLPHRKKLLWGGIMTVLLCPISFEYNRSLSQHLLLDSEGCQLFIRSVVVGTFAMAASVIVTTPSTLAIVKGYRREVGYGAGLVIGFAGIVGAITVTTSAYWSTYAIGLGGVCGAFLGLYTSSALIPVLIAIVCRIIAILTHFPQGISRLPENWQENNLLTDCRLPAELLPGIRYIEPFYTLDGFILAWNVSRGRGVRLLLLFVGPTVFLPVLLYRLSIKSTAWFWWPLAFLLKPAPAVDEEGARREALCGPWTNPMRKAWTLASVLLVLLPLGVSFLDFDALRTLSQADEAGAVPKGWEVLLAMRWDHLGLWDWMKLIMAGAGIGILTLSGQALSHQRNGNWSAISSSWPRWNFGMIALKRLHLLASFGVVILALGALTVQAEETHAFLPDAFVTWLRDFYTPATHP